MGVTSTLRVILGGLAVMLLLMGRVVRSDGYCDSRYVPVKKECCTLRAIILLTCCMKNYNKGGDCRCLKEGMSSSKWAECADSSMDVPPLEPTTTTTTTTPTPTTTSTPTTTTTPRPTTTSTTTTTTTPKPAMVTTPEASKRLCPVAPPAVIRSRLLFGDPVTDICAHNGMIALGIIMNGKKITFCNGVAYFNPSMQRREIVMDTTCWQLMVDWEQQGYKPFARSQGFEFPISQSWTLFSSHTTVSSTLTNHTIAVPTVTLAVLLDALVSGCDNTACLYNPRRMADALDLVNLPCFLLSYGSTGFDLQGESIAPNDLMRVQVKIVLPDYCGLKRDVKDVCCVEFKLPANTCIGDTSAGFFCRLKTGEDVLMGVTAFTAVCDGLTVYLPINKKLMPQ